MVGGSMPLSLGFVYGKAGWKHGSPLGEGAFGDAEFFGGVDFAQERGG